MNELFDAKESLSLQAREESLFQRLPALIENSKANSEHYAAHFSELELHWQTIVKGLLSSRLHVSSMYLISSNLNRRLVA